MSMYDFLFVCAGVVCVLFGLVCFVASCYWWVDKVKVWWAWIGPSVFFMAVGCFTIWRY